jgi:hypothetical protein
LGVSRRTRFTAKRIEARYISRNQWFMPFIRILMRYRNWNLVLWANLFGQKHEDKRIQLSLGFAYTLPMLVIFKLWNVPRWQSQNATHEEMTFHFLPD